MAVTGVYSCQSLSLYCRKSIFVGFKKQALTRFIIARAGRRARFRRFRHINIALDMQVGTPRHARYAHMPSKTWETQMPYMKSHYVYMLMNYFWAATVYIDDTFHARLPLRCLLHTGMRDIACRCEKVRFTHSARLLYKSENARPRERAWLLIDKMTPMPAMPLTAAAMAASHDFDVTVGTPLFQSAETQRYHLCALTKYVSLLLSK